MARSTDTSTHWSNPQLTSAFLPIKMARIGSGNFALTELIASSTCRRSAVSLPAFRNCILPKKKLPFPALLFEGQLKTRQAPGTSFEPYLIPVLADPKKNHPGP
jgi:hypothetical protein